MQGNLLLLALGAGSMIMWLIESSGFWSNVIAEVKQFNATEKTWNDRLAMQWAIASKPTLLFAVIIDISVTVTLLRAFGMAGTGGAILGLGISNVFSVFFIFIMWLARGAK